MAKLVMPEPLVAGFYMQPQGAYRVKWQRHQSEWLCIGNTLQIKEFKEIQASFNIYHVKF